MAKDLLEEKRKRQAQQPRDLLAEKRAQRQESQMSAPIPIMDNEGNDNANTAVYERLVQQFPRLAEAIGGMQLPEGVKKAGELAGKFNTAFESTGIPSAAGGLLQGAGNTAISIANLPLGLAGAHIPHLDLKQYAEPGLASSIGFGIGNVGGQIAGGLGATGLLGKLGQALNIGRPAGWAGLAADVAQPAAAGYLTGEDAEGGGRGLSALLGGAFGGVNALRNASIAKNIAQGEEAASKAGSEMYTKLFKEAETKGLKADKAPKIQVSKIKNAAPKKYVESLEKAALDPTIENMHQAQSDLGKWIRKVQPNVERGVATSPTIKAYNEAIEAQKRLRGSLFETLSKKGADQGLSKGYEEATMNWAKNVIPYKEAKSLEKFKAGKISADELIEKLTKDYSFAQSIGKEYPELALKGKLKGLSPIAKGAGAAALGIAGYDKLVKALKGEK